MILEFGTPLKEPVLSLNTTVKTLGWRMGSFAPAKPGNCFLMSGSTALTGPL